MLNFETAEFYNDNDGTSQKPKSPQSKSPVANKIVRHSSVSSFKKDRLVAEQTYRQLFDVKRKVISENGRILCQRLDINPVSLIPMRLEAFEAQDGDKDMANLHFQHYQKRRLKNLLRICDKLSSSANDNQYATQQITRNRSTEMMGARLMNSQPAKSFQSVSALSKKHLRKISEDLERKTNEDFQRLHQIFLHRQKKETQVLKNLKIKIAEVKSHAHKFNQRQSEITAKMLAKRTQEEREAGRQWKQQLLNSSVRMTSVSDLSQSKVLTNNVSSITLKIEKDKIEEDLQTFEEKLSKANLRAEQSKKLLRDKAASLNKKVLDVQNDTLPSIQFPGRSVSRDQADFEAKQFQKIQNMVARQKRIQQFDNDCKAQIKEQKEINRTKQEEKRQKIKELHRQEMQDMKKSVKEINDKLERAKTIKQEILTSSNKQVWLKQEQFKLRTQEIYQDKLFLDNDRKEHLRMVEVKHQMIQRNLDLKKQEELLYQKRLEVERKVIKQIEHQEKMKQAQVRAEIEAKLKLKADQEMKKQK